MDLILNLIQEHVYIFNLTLSGHQCYCSLKVVLISKLLQHSYVFRQRKWKSSISFFSTVNSIPAATDPVASCRNSNSPSPRFFWPTHHSLFHPKLPVPLKILSFSSLCLTMPLPFTCRQQCRRLEIASTLRLFRFWWHVTCFRVKVKVEGVLAKCF